MCGCSHHIQPTVDLEPILLLLYIHISRFVSLTLAIIPLAVAFTLASWSLIDRPKHITVHVFEGAVVERDSKPDVWSVNRLIDGTKDGQEAAGTCLKHPQVAKNLLKFA